jgi:hypothetical protein
MRLMLQVWYNQVCAFLYFPNLVDDITMNLSTSSLESATSRLTLRKVDAHFDNGNMQLVCAGCNKFTWKHNSLSASISKPHNMEARVLSYRKQKTKKNPLSKALDSYACVESVSERVCFVD